MITVTILCFDYALGSALMGMNDLLVLANGQGSQKVKQAPDKRFHLRLASWHGVPIRLLNGLTMSPHCAIQEIDHSDVILVPTIAGDVERSLETNLQIVDLLREVSGTTSLIGSNSTGSFFLAEAGLLEGRQATTHWSAVDLFRHRYPKVLLDPEQNITHDGNILCDAGGVAWFDMGLHMVELFMDHETAANTARYFVIDTGRSAHLTYSPMISKKYHNDQAIREVQQWLEAHYAEAISIEHVGDSFGLSQRSLIRRFKSACDLTPSQYVQELRLDAAIKMLMQTHRNIEEITHEVGYEDVSSFSRLFKRKTGMTPSSYRSRFKPMGSRDS